MLSNTMGEMAARKRSSAGQGGAPRVMIVLEVMGRWNPPGVTGSGDHERGQDPRVPMGVMMAVGEGMVVRVGNVDTSEVEEQEQVSGWWHGKQLCLLVEAVGGPVGGIWSGFYRSLSG